MAKEVNFSRLDHYWKIYLFALPSVVIISAFSYFPAVSAMYHAFYRWNCSTVNQFIGMSNFRDLLGWSPALWIVDAIWIVLMMMTLTRKPDWAKERAPYVLGGLVLTLAVMVNGYAATQTGNLANVRALNVPLNEFVKFMPVSVFCTLAGVGLHAFFQARWSLLVRGILVLYGFLWFFYKTMLLTGDQTLWAGFAVTFIFVVANIFKMIPAIATAVAIHRLKNERWQYIYRVLFVIPMIIPAMVYLLLWKFFYDPTQGILNRLFEMSGIMNLLVHLDTFFGWGIFLPGQVPAWLGDKALVIPSLIFWGFPWVGIVGVLIYLSGLQSIGTDVYEAADLDGVNWFQKFLHIEMPLIATQIRINMIMMIIATLKGYQNILVILGDSGGPQGVCMVPGLYMFRNAFVEGYAGKACAIGLLLFVFILLLTEINNRYVRVEK